MAETFWKNRRSGPSQIVASRYDPTVSWKCWIHPFV